jgi:hypothetical protein
VRKDCGDDVPEVLQKKAAETGTVDICRGSTTVARGLQQIGGGVAANLQAREPFNNPTDQPTTSGVVPSS